MPRKQNGFGNANSFAFKGNGRVDKGKGTGAFGFYPSNRRYGSSVHRTVIENWNLNSNWTKWRKGYELYNIAAYSLLRVENPDFNPGLPESDNNPQYIQATLESLLYQGTDYEIKTLFKAIEMPTMKSDVNTHYVVKRFIEEAVELGTITSRVTDNVAEQLKYNEVWFRGTPSESGRLLLQMENERVTDNETEATLKTVLTKSSKLNLDIPAVYKGKTPTDDALLDQSLDLKPTTVTVKIPIDNITITENKSDTYIVNQGLSTYTIPARTTDIFNDINQLTGKIVYIKDFFVDKPIGNVDEQYWQDFANYFTLNVVEKETGKDIVVLDPGVSTLPPSMYDINTLPSIFTSTDSEYIIKGSYAFLKENYQRYFGRKYLTGELIKDEITTISYSVFPFTILGAAIVGDYIELTSIPFTSEIKLYTDVSDGTVVFADNSFVRYTEPSSSRFRKAINTNVKPHQDEVFTSGNPLEPAEVYTCDCPSYSKTIIAMPQATQNNDERRVNRQNRYPLPTVLSANRFENLGIDKVSGKAASWETAANKTEYRMCKHTVAGMFVDGVQLIEPSEYPTELERDAFEDKLQKEISELDEAWRLSAERSGISLTEIVFSLSQGLNLDDVETGYVVLNSN